MSRRAKGLPRRVAAKHQRHIEQRGPLQAPGPGNSLLRSAGYQNSQSISLAWFLDFEEGASLIVGVIVVHPQLMVSRKFREWAYRAENRTSSRLPHKFEPSAQNVEIVGGVPLGLSY